MWNDKNRGPLCENIIMSRICISNKMLEHVNNSTVRIQTLLSKKKKKTYQT